MPSLIFCLSQNPTKSAITIESPLTLLSLKVSERLQSWPETDLASATSCGQTQSVTVGPVASVRRRHLDLTPRRVISTVVPAHGIARGRHAGDYVANEWLGKLRAASSDRDGRHEVVQEAWPL